ncbi:hypothetical protein L7F22_062866 [Adiantum nelumboides]|nr:hypothetical protein [Adiantum nelumboides]
MSFPATLFVFATGLYNVIAYFVTLSRVYRLVIASIVSLLTIVPTCISLGWALYELWRHPFSKPKYIAFGLVKYFLADAFQNVVDHISTLEVEHEILGEEEGANSARRRFGSWVGRALLYSDPCTRSYRRIHYTTAHVIDCDGADLKGSAGDRKIKSFQFSHKHLLKHLRKQVNRISIGNQSLTLVLGDPEGLWAREDPNAICRLYLQVGDTHLNKPITNQTGDLVREILAWWAENPERPMFSTYYPFPSKTAQCPSLYRLFCAIDENIHGRYQSFLINDYVHVG